jgi:multiple sugar transport system substrate-binding protein
MWRAAMRAALLACLLAGPAAAARTATLVINSNASDPAPRAAWERVIERFKAEHAGVAVQLNVFDHESYKRVIRNWLTSAAPDVVFWFAGNRMRQFASLGMLEDVSALFTPEMAADLAPAAIDLVTVAGKQYGLPYAFYQVGLYFRRDLLAGIGMGGGPRYWRDLLAACERLRAAGIEPIALGSKDLWPAAGWFDYIDLRLNGHAIHMQVMEGAIPYTDRRVRAVFEKWRELLDRRCFSRNHASTSWQESQGLLYQGRAAMMLIGNYIVPNFPPDIRPLMEFAPFPTIDPGIGRSEDAPMNSLHIPARARNKADARRFLAFVARPDVQEMLAAGLNVIPVNARSALSDDRFLQAGREHLAGADRLAQYFDRDTNEELASIAMKGFQEFMLRPERLDAILATIERARARIVRR